MTPNATSRRPIRSSRHSSGSAPRRARPRTSATRRSISALRRRPAFTQSPSRGAASTTTRSCGARSPTSSCVTRRSCLPSSSATTAARAAELREVLSRALVAYHVEDDPFMSDAEYDRLYDELVALEEAQPELVSPDSPTQRIGAPASDRFQKVRHLEQLGSLEKVATDEALLKWADDVRKRLGTDEPVAYVVEPKIDGLAVNLTYEDG